MNAFLTTIVLALALAACCEALGLKDSVALCDDDEGISAANKKLLLSNQPDTFANNKDVKSWLSCYYTDLNVIQRQPDGDTSEMLCRKAFVAAYPSMWLSGGGVVQKCNAQVKTVAGSEQAFQFHKCLLASGGFKL